MSKIENKWCKTLQFRFLDPIWKVKFFKNIITLCCNLMAYFYETKNLQSSRVGCVWIFTIWTFTVLAFSSILHIVKKLNTKYTMTCFQNFLCALLKLFVNHEQMEISVNYVESPIYNQCNYIWNITITKKNLCFFWQH